MTQDLPAQRLIAGIDVGTTGIKAGLFTTGGGLVASFSARHATHRPGPGLAEQDPAEWWALLLEMLAKLEAAAGDVRIAAVGLTSQVNTHVFCDAGLNPLLPAITWQDSRAAEDAALIDGTIAMDDKLSWWGAPLPVDASHVLARIAHLKRTRPDVLAATAHVLAPKDWCIARLTGIISTDPMTAFGIVDQSLSVISSLTARVDGAAALLPTVAAFTAAAGRIKPGLPCAGAAVATGAMDAWAGFLGAGAAVDGDCVLLSGTSDIIGIVSSRKQPTPGVIAFPPCEGMTIHAGPTQSGAASLDWAARLFNRSLDDLSAMVAAIAPDAGAPLFLPHLDGERAPVWDPLSRGTFAGASAAMGPEAFTLAVMEGVAYADRLLLDALEASSCLRPEVILHGGGGARSDPWCQIRADVLGRPVMRLANLDAGVAGAALLAGTAAGVFPSLAEGRKRFVTFERRFEPRPSLAARHAKRFALYRRLHGDLAGFHADLPN
jgi:xylulokinase